MTIKTGRLVAVVFMVALSLGILLPVQAPVAASACATIQEGTITDALGNPLSVGYDQWGYNYQARIFNGFYDNSSRPPVLVTEGDRLQMKWDDAWLSNKDCYYDGKLDRHYGFPTYMGSDAWLTNHQWGTDLGADGKTYKWDYYVLIVAVPTGSFCNGASATYCPPNEIWTTPTGDVIGKSILGEFAIVQEVYNDQGTGEHGLLYKGPQAPGLGSYK